LFTARFSPQYAAHAGFDVGNDMNAVIRAAAIASLVFAFPAVSAAQVATPPATDSQSSNDPISPSTSADPQPATTAATNLALHCAGAARHNAARHSSAVVFGPNGTASGEATSRELQDSDDEVFLRIELGRGRVRIPAILVPPAHGGGVDGWWQIANLKITDDEITGNIAFNFFNHPSIRVDRLNGSIQIEALAHTGFRGTCSADAVTQRKF
jgi:hypothetical protein